MNQDIRLLMIEIVARLAIDMAISQRAAITAAIAQVWQQITAVIASWRNRTR